MTSMTSMTLILAARRAAYKEKMMPRMPMATSQDTMLSSTPDAESELVSHGITKFEKLRSERALSSAQAKKIPKANSIKPGL